MAENEELERQVTIRTAELTETNQALRQEILQRQRAEAALKASEERFRNAFEHASIGVALLSPDGQWLEVNLALCVMLGYSEDALLQTSFQVLTHPDDIAADQANVQRLLGGAVSSYQCEKRYFHRDGHVVWASISVSLVRDSAQQPQYLIAQIQDISTRKQAEVALRESQELFQTFMDNSPAAAYIKDEAGRYTYANKPLIAYFHREIGHVSWQGKTDVELWPVARATELRSNDQAALDAERTLVVEETTADHDGAHTWLSFKFPLRVDSGQRFLAGVSIDITKRKRIEAWLESLINATQDAVIAINRQARIVRFNPAAEQIFGYSRTEVLGQKVNMLMADPNAREHDGYIARYERTHEARVFGRVRTEAARRKNGEVFPVEISLVEVTADPDMRYAAFIRDISEKVRLQEQLLERERLATIGTTAAKLAHEIGNPLNSMSMAAQLLQRRLETQHTMLDDKVFVSMRALHGEIARLSKLVQEFRALSRQQQFSLQPTDVRAVVSEVLTAEQASYATRGIVVEQTLPTDLPLVAADADKLKQVVLNLCKNAVEAMPAGGTLGVTVHNAQARVAIEVRDTGVGIPMGVNIFELFVTTKADGTGLGLPIVRQIVEAHRGTLTYTSEVGKGTTFIVSLPIMLTGDSSDTV